MDATEYESRIEKIRKLMVEENIDVILAYANYKHGGHVQYLTGYQVIFGGWQSVKGTENVLFGSSASLLFMEGPPVLFTDSFFGSSEEDHWIDYSKTDARGGLDFAPLIKDVIAEKKFKDKRIGIEAWDVFPTPLYLKLKSYHPDAEFGPSTIMERMRMVKSEAELELIREAEKITDMGCQAGLDAAVPGNTDKDVCNAFESVLREHGDLYISTPSDVCAGLRTCSYINQPIGKKLEPGDLIKMDSGARFQMYSGDISRCKVVGADPTPDQRKLLETVLRMNLEVIANIKPGVKTSELSEISKRVAVDAGYEPSMVARLTGHGIGLDIHERPDYGVDETVLQPNMVITVEPTVMVPNLGGVRIEDVVRVTETGAEVFSKTERKLWP